MNPPRVSVVIPTKNRYALLRQSIESVRRQSCPDWEAIIVDDGSTDETVEQMTRLAREQPRLRFQRRQSSQPGASVCRNEGWRGATAEFVIFLDSDDVLAPDCLEHRLAVIRADDDFVVFAGQPFHREPGDSPARAAKHGDWPDLERFLALDNPWQAQGPLWRRSALATLGGWDETLPSWQDWELHVRALMRGCRYRKFDKVDAYWRLAEPQGDTIGIQSYAPDHLQAQEKLIARVHQSLTLDTCRRRLLAGRYMWLAIRWTMVPSLPDARRVWAQCRQSGLVGAMDYAAGWLYLAARQPRWVGLWRKLR